MPISPAKFDQLVQEGLALIPAEFRQHIENVAVVIEDEPDDEIREEMELGPDETLYGLYDGVPLTERGIDDPLYPARIIIYRQPLLEDFETPDAIRREVARTVIHEVAHHFGIEEDRLTELGWE